MPCVEETPKDINAALQILGVVAPRISVSGDTDTPVVRETTQTDHLNKRLLKTFLDRLNAMAVVHSSNNVEEHDNFQDFDE